MSGLDDMERELQDGKDLHHVDSLGREYSVPSGTKPLDINYEPYPDLKNKAIRILEIAGMEGHLNYIDSGFIDFQRSHGRKETNCKEIYIHGIRTSLQCYYGSPVGYVIETTIKFERLNLVEQLDNLFMVLMKCKVDRDKPTGKFVSYNSFRGFDSKFKEVIETLKNDPSIEF